MLYKVGSMGYFGGVQKISRGPWFREYFVEDDGLDWFYTCIDNDGNKRYLLSNNMSLEDRTAFGHLYNQMWRNQRLAAVGGLWVAFEVITRDSYFKKMALGWRALSFLGIAWAGKQAVMGWSSQMYNPLFGAYFRKYSDKTKTDMFEIQDEKKQYFYIDTSEYMSYSNETLSDEYHCNHGPQPEGEVLDSSWLTEVDKFLKGEPNNLKGHKKFYDYNFELIDKSYPSMDAVSEMMSKKD